METFPCAAPIGHFGALTPVVHDERMFKEGMMQFKLFRDRFSLNSFITCSAEINKRNLKASNRLTSSFHYNAIIA